MYMCLAFENAIKHALESKQAWYIYICIFIYSTQNLNMIDTLINLEVVLHAIYFPFSIGSCENRPRNTKIPPK